MSFSSTESSSICSSSSVGCPIAGICPKVSPTLYYAEFEDDEDSLTETNSSVSLIEDVESSVVVYENNDSDCSDYETDDSFQEFSVKDWLRLARAIISKNVLADKKHKLIEKYDELQEFFYFFASEYFSIDNNLAEFIHNKRKEFILTWKSIIGSYTCEYIFDFLVDLMDDINADNSFRL